MTPSFPRQNQAVVLRDTRHLPPGFRLRGCHPLRRGFPAHFGYPGSGGRGALQPHIPPDSSPGGSVWALPLSVAPTQGIPFWFLLLPLLRCFRWGGSRSVLPLRVSRALRAIRPQQEVPFGDPRIEACLRLPGAYRRLPRPSSAPEPSHPPGGLVPSTSAVLVCTHPTRHSFAQTTARPFGLGHPPGNTCSRDSSVKRLARGEWRAVRGTGGKGGDPAAGSPTATLLRLLPPWGARVRPPTSRQKASPGPPSGGATGGVCKEQGRIHRALVTRGY